mmetsp:Transcript_67157/g.93487  ORF Transcript_67157/g.93487 Transcript_67157/m.93487 type:complete len:103 (-) Transcript_67157:97-405(-)
MLHVIGIIGLLHAAWSATEHRHHLKLQSETFESLPNDILLEAFVFFAIAVLGVVQSKMAELEPINAVHNLNLKTGDNVFQAPSFYSFKHRGRVLFPTITRKN